MKWFDPHLIKFAIIGLVFIGRAISSWSRKQKSQNAALRRQQNTPIAPPIDPSASSAPSMSSNTPPPRVPTSKSQPSRKSSPDSPWSDLK